MDEAGPRENRLAIREVDYGHVIIGGADSAVEGEGHVKAGFGQEVFDVRRADGGSAVIGALSWTDEIFGKHMFA